MHLSDARFLKLLDLFLHILLLLPAADGDAVIHGDHHAKGAGHFGKTLHKAKITRMAEERAKLYRQFSPMTAATREATTDLKELESEIKKIIFGRSLRTS